MPVLAVIAIVSACRVRKGIKFTDCGTYSLGCGHSLKRAPKKRRRTDWIDRYIIIKYELISSPSGYSMQAHKLNSYINWCGAKNTAMKIISVTNEEETYAQSSIIILIFILFIYDNLFKWPELQKWTLFNLTIFYLNEGIF